MGKKEAQWERIVKVIEGGIKNEAKEEEKGVIYELQKGMKEWNEEGEKGGDEKEELIEFKVTDVDFILYHVTNFINSYYNNCCSPPDKCSLELSVEYVNFISKIFSLDPMNPITLERKTTEIVLNHIVYLIQFSSDNSSSSSSSTNQLSLLLKLSFKALNNFIFHNPLPSQKVTLTFSLFLFYPFCLFVC